MERQESTMINNAFYDDLGEEWYHAGNHPIALLRAENEVRAPWVVEEIEVRIGKKARVLDVGCGAGFLSNQLAVHGFDVVGLDLSQSSLDVAAAHDATHAVKYIRGDAYHLPFADARFDVVCAMDILEHLEEPARAIQQAARVLKPGGLFFFHTFNRTPLSYLVAIKGLEWCVANAPKNIHVYKLFITPKELKQMCAYAGLGVTVIRGLVPKVCSTAFWKMLWTRQVPQDFTFRFTKSLATGYCGVAKKIVYC